MKKLDSAMIYVLACILSLNNAYMTFGTDYHLMYGSWILVSTFFFGCSIFRLFKK